ncbi:hypothetical protein SGCZBJ_08085 [Caulobacter zeae]|uniref:Uncharacterized protein n=1 Tax=Caulobacter zeae TaxID=2055137 RepID=A0A2N5DMW7_9CAUL|nr:hypothetical protein [Caulobacter zeae]PLR27345.1 hypothetical protein SGCZBJ_08085 [Caulobacter zeae]
MFSSVFFAAALLQASLALPPENCRGDNHADRCAPEDRARIVAKRGMASADAEAKAGVEAYRAFFVDGYGRERPTIAFERRPGQPPKAVVYAQDRKLEAPASLTAWNKVKTDAQFADRALAPLPPAKPADALPNICLHAWVSSVEIVNAPTREGGDDKIRSRTENACGPGLTTQFTFELATLAIQQFPACEALSESKYRNDIERLAACTLLHGDTLAAAGFASQTGGWLELRRDLEPAMAWSNWIGTNAKAELNWNGQVAKDDIYRRNNVGKFLAAQSATARLSLYPDRIEGVDGRTVKVTGRVHRASLSEPQVRDSAPSDQTWIWDTGLREWMLKSWTVGAFAVTK